MRISREAVDKLLDGQQPRDPYDRKLTDLIMRVAVLEAERRAYQAIVVYLLSLSGGEVTVPDAALAAVDCRLSVSRDNANSGMVLRSGDNWEDAMHVTPPPYLRD